MKLQVALAAAALALGMAATPSIAATAPKVKAHVIQRNNAGRATMVSVNGKDYAVCSNKVTDSCINPRQAGLDFGTEPLNHWPGHPASWHKPMHKKWKKTRS